MKVHTRKVCVRPAHFDLQPGTGAAKVQLTNLDIEGGRTGVRVLDNVQLVVDNCIIRDTSAYGIDMQPRAPASPPGQPYLRVEDSEITGVEDTNLDIGTGIVLQDAPGDGQEVLIRQSVISGNYFPAYLRARRLRPDHRGVPRSPTTGRRSRAVPAAPASVRWPAT